MQAKRGFTLVEILIVVVILGILAAIVIPQFTQASTEAKTNSLASDLQSLRSQIQLYKVQHNDVAPGFQTDTFANQMLFVSNVDGLVNVDVKVRDDTYDKGPYLERVPINPFTGTASVVGWGASADASPFDGWEYNSATGEIRAAKDNVDPNLHQSM
jgi:general secretion pathway protein G